MSSHDNVEKDLKITDVQDVGEVRSEKLDSILMTLAAMEEKFTMSFRGTKHAVEDVYSEIDKRISKSEEFVEVILCKFTNLENHIIDEIHGRPRRESIYVGTEVASEMSDFVLRLDVQDLCELDSTEETKTDKLLREIKDKIDQLETMMDEKFNEVSEAIEKTRTTSLLHGKIQEIQREKVEKRFHEHEEFIRNNLLKLLWRWNMQCQAYQIKLL